MGGEPESLKRSRIVIHHNSMYVWFSSSYILSRKRLGAFLKRPWKVSQEVKVIMLSKVPSKYT